MQGATTKMFVGEKNVFNVTNTVPLKYVSTRRDTLADVMEN